MDDAELQARLALHLTPGLGPRRIQRLLDCFADGVAALAAPAADWQRAGLPKTCAEARTQPRIRTGVQQALDWLQGPGHHLLMSGHTGYPALLAELPDPPPLLFVAGDPAVLEAPQLAIVGSRRASRQGADNAAAFARSLSAAGLVVTSGLALGIDGAAHAATLGVGRTVAVLGTGLQRIYPRQHQRLAAEIIEQGGALVSELPLDTAPVAANFPRRNRIISGLSLGVLVVEASPASGSLITARLAAEQGREVLAIPGSIHHPGARGCHQLIRDGAVLVESVQDILEALQGWQQVVAAPEPPATPERMAGTSSHPLVQLLRAGPLSTDALTAASGLDLPELLTQLTELEIEGAVCQDAGLWQARG